MCLLFIYNIKSQPENTHVGVSIITATAELLGYVVAVVSTQPTEIAAAKCTRVRRCEDRISREGRALYSLDAKRKIKKNRTIYLGLVCEYLYTTREYMHTFFSHVLIYIFVLVRALFARCLCMYMYLLCLYNYTIRVTQNLQNKHVARCIITGYVRARRAPLLSLYCNMQCWFVLLFLFDTMLFCYVWTLAWSEIVTCYLDDFKLTNIFFILRIKFQSEMKFFEKCFTGIF